VTQAKRSSADEKSANSTWEDDSEEEVDKARLKSMHDDGGEDFTNNMVREQVKLERLNEYSVPAHFKDEDVELDATESPRKHPVA